MLKGGDGGNTEEEEEEEEEEDGNYHTSPTQLSRRDKPPHLYSSLKFSLLSLLFFGSSFHVLHAFSS